MADKNETDVPAKALWGGRFAEGMAPEMLPLNLCLPVDGRLWREDIQGSRAWARALVGAGVLTPDEGARLQQGLGEVARRIEAEGLGGAPEEDIHSAVERMLREAAGHVAGKLHTGRSRNDQSSTDVRLYGMAAAELIGSELDRLCTALLDLAERGVDDVMPGYTHLQQGQPIRAAHWALSHLWAFMRDRERVAQARRSAAVLPLGSGAIAGCPFPVDRAALAKELGFLRISENSIDAVGDRDWICDLAYAGAMVGVHLSRLGEDVVLFSTTEFGFLRLSDGFSTGSSLMPQKRNPDAAELARGKSARLVGNLTGLLALLKGLPTGYNRDLQEDKEFLFDTVDTLRLVLPAMAGAMETAAFRPDRMEAVMDAQLLATDLADYLVRRGVPFRESHEVVGRLVRRSEQAGVSLSSLELSVFQEEHPAFGADVHDVFHWARSADSRDSDGGTSRRAVRQQLDAARVRLGLS
ncbi:MAG TPA: argininosuccinate lyase [Longimicrobiales bacterium]|nr:argininosuccinate lyase [Longimicrobiales bacterium]